MKKTSRAVAVAASVGALIAITVSPAAAGPTLVAERVGAYTQPSTWADQWARSIKDLALLGDGAYAGWGNYDTNIGPVKIASVDVNTGAETVHFTLNGEEANVLRQYGGKLYVPDIDPKLSWSSRVGYATSSPQWRYVAATPAQHIFDAAEYAGSLFVAGAMSNPDKATYGPTNDLAFIAQSDDGGATWTVVRWKATDPAVGHSGYDRYYWLAVAGGKLFASATVEGRSPIIEVYSGGTWAAISTTNYWVNRTYEPHRVESNGSWIVGHARGTDVWVIDGNARLKGKARGLVVSGKIPTSGTIMDLTVDGTTFYAAVRGENGTDDNDEIWSSPDGINWTLVAEVDIPVPNWFYTWHNGEVTTEMRATATSLAVRDAAIYLGTNMGDLWVVRP